MTKKNTILLLALAAILLIALCLGFKSCSGSEKPETGETTPAPVVGTEKRTYTLVLKTEGGKVLEDVGVYFYTDSTMAELVWFAKTDAEGRVSFTDLESTGYVAVLDKVPEGYRVESYYALNGETTEVVLATDMADGDLETLAYKLGDVMMNFSVTDAEGKTHILSDLLAEKKAVVLNFWYLQCAPCRAEFPYLQEAYETYSDKIALLAMNPINDDNEAIKAFAKELGLTFPMAHCDANWEKAMQLTAYPTTVVIDRFGTIALIHKGGIDEAKVFEDAFAFFTADDYEQTTVEDILDLEIKAEGSDSSNPISIGSKTSFDVTLAPGQKAYYHIYRVDDMTLTVGNTNIGAEYNKRTYGSGNGLSFTVNCPDTYTPAAVTFINEGTQTETFTVRLTAKPGTVDNPHVLKKTGEFSVQVEKGNEQGVYYTYTPKEDGLLTVQCTSISPKKVKYGISLTTQKGNATVQRNLEEDGDAETGTVSISVKKGVKVQIIVSTLPDDTKSYPAASLKCTLSIGEDTTKDEDAVKKIQYGVTITDQDQLPIPGVFMNFTKVSGGSEKTETIPQQKTGEAGAACLDLEEAVYEVVLSPKAGYEAATTQFRLTPDRPYATIKMVTREVEKATYTIAVTDPDGNPLAGVVVMLGLGLEPQTTDSTGKAVFADVPKDTYVVYVTAPDGFAAEPAGYAMESGKLEHSVQLKKPEDEKPEDPDKPVVKADYVITVVDYEDNPLSGISVQILSGGVPVTSPMSTDAAGKVTTNLVTADYTVALALNKSQRYYETDTAVLPEGTTELTIRVAPAVSGTPEELYVGDAYYLNVGGNYVTMQANAVNYYIFAPEEAGLYHFSTSDPAAVLSYWGGSQFFIQENTDVYDPATNSFTRNIKEDQAGNVIVIIGVTGEEDCIVEVTRIGDPILDESDIEPEIYKAKKTPTKQKLSAAVGRSLKYLDLTATGGYKIVLDSSGYYHLNSADGPKLYMNLGPNARYISMYNMLGFTGFGGTSLNCVFRDANGSVTRKEDYTACMSSYVEAIDATYGVYPLTEDLVYMMQMGGGYKGWWDLDNANCVFLDEEGNLDPPNLNLDIAWMFAIMYES